MQTLLSTRRFTVEEYDRMGAAGIFGPEERVELLDGEIYPMSPIGIRHATTVKKLNRLFSRKFGDGCVLGIQDPVQLDDYSEPQPDVVLLKPTADFYESGHPDSDDTLLIVEVSETTLRFDRGKKLPIYARDGIVEVWIVNLEAGVIEQYRKPADGAYKQFRQFSRGEQIEVEALGGVSFAVSEILPSSAA